MYVCVYVYVICVKCLLLNCFIYLLLNHLFFYIYLIVGIHVVDVGMWYMDMLLCYVC